MAGMCVKVISNQLEWVERNAVRSGDRETHFEHVKRIRHMFVKWNICQIHIGINICDFEPHDDVQQFPTKPFSSRRKRDKLRCERLLCLSSVWRNTPHQHFHNPFLYKHTHIHSQHTPSSTASNRFEQFSHNPQHFHISHLFVVAPRDFPDRSETRAFLFGSQTNAGNARDAAAGAGAGDTLLWSNTSHRKGREEAVAVLVIDFWRQTPSRALGYITIKAQPTFGLSPTRHPFFLPLGATLFSMPLR